MLIKKVYSRFTFVENTIGNSPEVLRARESWKVMNYSVLLTYASLAVSQGSLACLNFILDSEDLFC